MHDLGTFGGTYSQAWGINDRGEVVGESNTSGDASTDAFLYDGSVMYDLNNVVAGASDVQFNIAQGINDAEQIVANGCYISGPLEHNCHAFLLAPETQSAGVPEPTAVTLFAVGMLGLAGLRRRNRVTGVSPLSARP
jgi:probable HAF family extracellular repeat protein